MLDKNSTLDFGKFNRLDQMAQQYHNGKLAKQATDQGLALNDAKIKNEQAEAASHWATAAHERAATSEIGEAKNRASLEAAALKDYSDNKGDIDKVSPGHRLVLQNYSVNQAKDILAAIKDNMEAVQMGDPEAKSREGELWNQYNQLQQLGSLTKPEPTIAPVTFVNPQGQKVVANTQAMVDKAIKLGYTKEGTASPTEQVVVKTPTGNTILQRGEFENLKKNPPVGRSSDSVGEIVGPAPKPFTPRETLSGLDLTKGNSY